MGPALAMESKEAIKRLRALGVKPGATIYTVLRHRSSSGMYRVLDLYIIKRNQPLYLTRLACAATGARWDQKHDGMSAPGCGLDVGFEAVYTLGRAMWPNGGYTLAQRWL